MDYNYIVRVFIGISIHPETKAQILEKLKPFQEMHTPIRWTAPENIHLTLKFLGEVEESLYAKAEKALAEPYHEIHPFEAVIRSFGKFPAGPQLSIFWVSMDPSLMLRALHGEIEKRLAAFPCKKEEREFTPHITLGRNKAIFNFKSMLQKLEQLDVEPIARMPIHAFQFFLSTLSPKGPVYHVLKEVSFA